MSYTDQLLQNNRAYAATFAKGYLSHRPGTINEVA
jgi:hypothetical protein